MYLPDVILTSRQSEQLDLYLALLCKWQKAINLVSPNTLSEARERHFWDSAQLSILVPDTAKLIADIGSGAGFPGLVLAVLRPAQQFCLIESDARKGQFLRTVSREAKLENVKIMTARVEEMAEDFVPDVVTARALADVSDLLGYILPWAKKNPSLRALFLKGERWDSELEIAKKRYNYVCEAHPSATHKKARILQISNISACA